MHEEWEFSLTITRNLVIGAHLRHERGKRADAQALRQSFT